MSGITYEAAVAALKTVDDPELKKDLITLNMARNIQISGPAGDVVNFTLVLTTPACPLRNQIEEDCQRALLAAGARVVQIETTAEVRSFRGTSGKQPVPGIKNILAVSSGKGGVGKSTVSVNLAVALKQLGARVGILDADITTPNIPLMLGITRKLLTSEDGKKIIPEKAYDLQVVSMGALVDDDEPIVWRGPMLHSAINQFFRDVAWDELDYLVVDLPPGTSDAQLTISQAVPLTGALIVSTPQDVALLDSKKALMMFRKMQVEVLGLVENMSYFIAPDTGKHYDIFGTGGAKKTAEQLGLECLGQIPLEIPIRQHGDRGQPIALQSDHTAAQVFQQIAQRLAAKISIQAHARAEVP